MFSNAAELSYACGLFNAVALCVKGYAPEWCVLLYTLSHAGLGVEGLHYVRDNGRQGE